MKEAGLCPLCPRANPKPAEPDKTACHDCLKWEADEQISRRDHKRQRGICLRCQRPAVPATVWCAEHRQALDTERISRRCQKRRLTEPYARTCPACRAAAKQAKRQKDNELNRQKLRQRTQETTPSQPDCRSASVFTKCLAHKIHPPPYGNGFCRPGGSRLTTNAKRTPTAGGQSESAF